MPLSIAREGAPAGRSNSASENAKNAARNVPRISRARFLKEVWRYRQGQHVSFLGPTRRGKTTFAIELLKETISPQLPCVILAGKPGDRDDVMGGAAKELNLRIVTEWPPMRTPRDRNRNGFVLRPHHTMTDPEQDEKNLAIQYQQALRRLYASKKGKPVIVVADEAHHVQVDLKLKKECENILMRGGPVVALWSLIQRGFYLSYHCYAAPEHVFIFHDPDTTNQDRYKDLGGIDPRTVKEIVANLKTYETEGEGNTISECLYIRRSGPRLMIVDTE